MKAEVISIGSELTSGQNLDTNSQWLSQRLSEVGIPVGWHTTVGDDLNDNIDAFRSAAARAALVMVSGGLGPTQDDLTREAVAQAAGVEVVFNAEAFAQIEAMFAARGRVMPERNRVQACFPAGAQPIPNHRGSAPGFWMRLRGSPLVAMPGVPSEMKAMFHDSVVPVLQSLELSQGLVVERKINCFGLGESALESKVLDLTRRGHVPEVGITVHDGKVALRIRAHAACQADALAQIAPIEAIVRDRLSEVVFGTDNEELQNVVASALSRRRLTLATAEGVTGGLVARRLAAVPGSSAWFRGGIVAYDSRLKIDLLAVPQDLIDTHGAVSRQVAEAMAIACRVRLRSDLAVSTVGIAGPQAAAEERPVGLVWVGVAGPSGCSAQSFSWTGTRIEVQKRTANLALNLVRLQLLR